ncbi:MAG: putative DNA-binding domain-containing protein [Burkholderiales bacterium]|nr:putative DNA-binding domain-containing protein [Burkholderiales bacterium]
MKTSAEGGAEDAAAACTPESEGRRTERLRQTALLQALLQTDTERARLALQAAGVPLGPLGEAGLRAHRRHADAQAQRVLLSHFPTVAAMLGDEALGGLARALWRSHPPHTGDLADWGEALPDALAAHPDLRAWPWLADCARLDWARHRCERSADAALDADSLQRLADTDPGELRLVLHPGVTLLHSTWPLQALWQAHEQPAGDARNEAAARALTGGAANATAAAPRWFVVWRHPWRAQVAELSAPHAGWMRGWGAAPSTPSPPSPSAAPSRTLADALDQAPADFDFQAWLTDALRHGWLWRVQVGPAGA